MEVFIGMFFCWRTKEETPRAAGKTCQRGFQLRLYKGTGQALQLPTVVPLKGEKPKLD